MMFGGIGAAGAFVIGIAEAGMPDVGNADVGIPDDGIINGPCTVPMFVMDGMYELWQSQSEMYSGVA